MFTFCDILHKTKQKHKQTKTAHLCWNFIFGYFPMDWKQALVKPLLKKPGLQAQFKNLRPISNIQFISKICVKKPKDLCMSRHTIIWLHIILSLSFGPPTGHGTALLKVHNDILLNMDRQRTTLFVLLDLSAAFDTLNHEILLRRL